MVPPPCDPRRMLSRIPAGRSFARSFRLSFPEGGITNTLIASYGSAKVHKPGIELASASDMGSRHHPAQKQRLGSRSGNGSVRCRSWTPTPGGWVGGGDVACDGLGSGAGVALEGPDGGVPGPGEQHRGAGAVLGLVGEKAVPELVKGPAVHLL